MLRLDIYVHGNSTSGFRAIGYGSAIIEGSEGLTVNFSLPTDGRHHARKAMLHLLARDQSLQKFLNFRNERWYFDLDMLKSTFVNTTLMKMEWLSGLTWVEPEEDSSTLGMPAVSSYKTYSTNLSFNFLKGQIMSINMPIKPPIEIEESLRAFQCDYPDSRKDGFVMMKFADTVPHRKIVATINETSKALGISVLRADLKEYHSDLFSNVLTYIHGCGFGIAIYDRVQNDDFNPNVALEVGYMLALQKSVLLLKEKSLNALNTDIMAKIYRPFDIHNIENTIPANMTNWLRDKNFVP